MSQPGYTSGFGKNRGKSARFQPRSPEKTQRIRLIPVFWSNATHAPRKPGGDGGNSSTIVDIPANESQARALSQVDPDKRREVWDRAVASSRGGKPTAKRVKEAARAVKKPRPVPPGRPGTDSEERRKEQALRGITVLAHMSRDQVLVEWATGEGRLERIDGTTARGNPMTPEWMGGDRAAVVAWYRDHWFPFVRDALRLDDLGGGKVLACWCHPGPCHGDVILEGVWQRFATNWAIVFTASSH
jgi:Domain of unknown function (DUF4326)